MITALIAILHIGCFIFVLFNIRRNGMFQTNRSKTIMLLWIQIQIITVPIKLLYYLYTVKILLINRQKKNDNLNNPDIKEAIKDGAGL